MPGGSEDRSGDHCLLLRDERHCRLPWLWQEQSPGGEEMQQIGAGQSGQQGAQPLLMVEAQDMGMGCVWAEPWRAEEWDITTVVATLRGRAVRVWWSERDKCGSA